ncbi:hypothetical protein MsAm2_10280 [Methanolapillus ohkumae]|uniref:Uncharacterized protein n=2 Tax=Methanolapillus ohkumae TaxID=3028298 RepID=A0AA96V7H4_9EURY|nr:hypothetical protein MsAm2_10280 [Methanosarcinaceae archaeon Am2]
MENEDLNFDFSLSPDFRFISGKIFFNSFSGLDTQHLLIQKTISVIMSEPAPSFLSRFTTKQFYVFVAIGLMLLIVFSFFAYTSGNKFENESLPQEERDTQGTIYVISKIGQMVGFLIALIPSIGILKKEMEKYKEENPTMLIEFSEDSGNEKKKK